MVAGSRQLKSMADKKAFLPSKLLSKVESDGRHAGQSWLIFFIGMFFMTTAFLISEVLSSGASAEKAALYTKEITFDNMGNAITLFGFALYAILGFGVFANRFTNKFKVDKQKFSLLQIGAATLTLWIVIQNTVGYFLAENKITMWLVLLSLFILYVTNKIVSLTHNEYH